MWRAGARAAVVAKSAAAFSQRLRAATTIRQVRVNGEPGLIAYVDGKPLSVLIFSIRGDRIRTIYAVANPDTLGRLPPLA